MRKKKKVNLRNSCPNCSSNKYFSVYKSTVNFANDLNTKIFSARRLPDKVHGTIVKCSKCNLVRTLEIVKDTNLSKLYLDSLFTYKDLTANLLKSYGKILQGAALMLKTKKNFLEIGCGNGFMFKVARKIGFHRVYGIEPSSDAISKASRIDKKSIKQNIFKKGIFPKNTFDLICAFQVFDHIPDPNTFLKNCLDILSPGGILVLMNHDVESFSAKVLGEKSPIFDIEHTFLYSRQTIKAILKKNNFLVENVYHPQAIFTLRYLIRLLPLPNFIKKSIETSKLDFLNVNLKIYPGNLCAIARKAPFKRSKQSN